MIDWMIMMFKKRDEFLQPYFNKFFYFIMNCFVINKRILRLSINILEFIAAFIVYFKDLTPFSVIGLFFMYSHYNSTKREWYWDLASENSSTKSISDVKTSGTEFLVNFAFVTFPVFIISPALCMINVSWILKFYLMDCDWTPPNQWVLFRKEVLNGV